MRFRFRASKTRDTKGSYACAGFGQAAEYLPPAPGSDEARQNGCTCQPAKNADVYRRALGEASDAPVCRISDRCPVHGVLFGGAETL